MHYSEASQRSRCPDVRRIRRYRSPRDSGRAAARHIRVTIVNKLTPRFVVIRPARASLMKRAVAS